jgi:wobble nucleotide-excising tRNase
LESYFLIFGGVNPDDICKRFDGQEKLICNSLFSWVNAGSHHAHDDLYVSIDEPTVETYLKVFKGIFEKTNHLGHYQMMMGDADPEIPAEGSHDELAV